MGSSAHFSPGARVASRRSARRWQARKEAAVLEVKHLTKRFGGLAAVNDVSTTIEAGRINAIIGPNGAGKTTFFNLINGVHRPTSGSITFKGEEVTNLPA